MSSEGPSSCQLSELFRLLSKAHLLDIMHAFMQQDGGPLRFVDLQNALGISPNTLSDRLKTLVKHGLLEREAFQEIPPRVEYTATASMNDLERVFSELGRWAEHHALAP